MVAFLHGYGSGPFQVLSGSSTFLLAGHTANLIINQGHTTNGAGGTAPVLVGFGSIIALILERRARNKVNIFTTHQYPFIIDCLANVLVRQSSTFFYLWAVIVVLSCLLSLSALIYTFVEAGITDNQGVSIAVAQQNVAPARYPLDRWTPENWYLAVLELPLMNARNKNVIIGKLRLIRGWRWNTIPLFLPGLLLAILVAAEVIRGRKVRRGGKENGFLRLYIDIKSCEIKSR